MGTVIDISDSVTINLLKRYISRMGKIHFVVNPGDTVVVDDLNTSLCLTSLPDPMVDRRGTTIIYSEKVFKPPLKFIY